MVTIQELSNRIEEYKSENFELLRQNSLLTAEKIRLLQEVNAYRKILIALGERLP